MKKKILALTLCVAMVAIAVAGATLAYFTDTDSKTNTFTSGNVQITQNEKDRDGNDYGDETKKLMPIVNDKKDDNGYHTGANYIDKIVTVTNNGTEDAYIRTHLAFPAALDDGANTFNALKNILHWNGASATDEFGAANPNGVDNDWYYGISTDDDWPGNGGVWNAYQTTVDDVLYNVYVATHGSIVEAGDTTAPNLYGVYLDKDVDYNGTNYVNKDDEVIDFDLTETKILVVSEAVQAEGFDTNDKDVAFKALDEAFGAIGTYCPFGGTVAD